MDEASTGNVAVLAMGRPGEEEEESWIPLVQEEPPRSSQLQQQIAAPNFSTSPFTPPRRESLEATQKRMDARIRLKRGLVDHPLNQGWRFFAKHFASEIWQLDVHLRLGIVLVVIGSILQMFMWALSFRWYHPRTIILSLVFAVSFVYLAPEDVEKQIRAFFRLLTTPNREFDVADYVDPTTMRKIFLALLVIPTLLEARTFGFLSKVMAESGLANNVSVGFVLAAFLAYRLKKQKSTPRECIQRGIHILYGFALLVSILRVDLGRLPALMGPFFLATGTLVLSYRDDDMNWLSRSVRHALRLTLRDVLASVSETVAEDEMLQLAMLRWIVDYWSYQPPETRAPVPNSTTSDRESHPTPTASSFPVRITQPQPVPHQELQWEQLRPMLDMTTDQMIEEVPTHTPHYTRIQSESRPPSTDSCAQTKDNESLHNLKSMLAALDIDDRAKPAVMAYKQAVAAFPPSRRQALWFSVVRRCPAMLMLLYRYMIASDLAFASTVTLLPFAIMEAFRVLHWAEACQRAFYCGAQNSENEQLAAGGSIAPSISIPVGMDSMCILLSGDFYTPSRPPSLLQVWVNICSSVAALEMGLTAARCAQTTAVAADFAGNIISLAQFGVEVSQHGWAHGLTVMVQELVHLHATQSTGRNTKYASAAINAVRNGSIFARNVRALAEENGGNPVIEPLLDVLSAIVGRGWLWGRENNQESTVTVEEISVEEKPSERDEQDLSIELEESSIEAISLAQDAETVLSGDGAQTDEPASVAPEPDSKLLPQLTNEDNSMEDLSELMQLIADAFEQGLILEVSSCDNMFAFYRYILLQLTSRETCCRLRRMRSWKQFSKLELGNIEVQGELLWSKWRKALEACLNRQKLRHCHIAQIKRQRRRVSPHIKETWKGAHQWVLRLVHPPVKK